jgi:hypothetical protein
MKKIFWLLAAFLVTSCLDDDRNNEIMYTSYGVVKEDAQSGGKLYVRSDKGAKIAPMSSGLLTVNEKDKRVWLLFSTDVNVESDTIKAKVYDFLKVTEMELKKEYDDWKSDEVNLNKVWVAQNFLTMTFKAFASSESSLKNHKYVMYSDLEVRNDTLKMEFKYDNDNDSRTYAYNKVVALKLDSIIDKNTADSVVLAIRYLNHSEIEKTVYAKYKYEK